MLFFILNFDILNPHFKMNKILIYFYVVIGLWSCTSNEVTLLVGTYTDGNSEGIYQLQFDQDSGEFSDAVLIAKVENPSFFTYGPNKKYLYTVSETNAYNGTNSGSINAYKVLNGGQLQFLNTVSSQGAHPCHIAIDLKGKNVVVSNYTGGTVALYHTLADGSLSESFQVLDHNNTNDVSHTHSANFYNNNLFVADLGRDFLAQYVQNNDNSENYVLKEHHFMKDNAGPRHFEISSDGASIYVINELNSTITVLKKEGHKYLNIQNISTLSDVYSGKNSCADIHLSKNEKYLYGSNRGENSIVVFKRDKSTDLLQKIQTISTHGDWPRNFTLAPNGKFLLVANQKSNTISVYNINEKTGTLTFSGSVAIPAPVCLLF